MMIQTYHQMKHAMPLGRNITFQVRSSNGNMALQWIVGRARHGKLERKKEETMKWIVHFINMTFC
jgi:hypothetical protein